VLFGEREKLLAAGLDGMMGRGFHRPQCNWCGGCERRAYER
jgi:hypothetical protein